MVLPTGTRSKPEQEIGTQAVRKPKRAMSRTAAQRQGRDGRSKQTKKASRKPDAMTSHHQMAYVSSFVRAPRRITRGQTPASHNLKTCSQSADFAVPIRPLV